MSTPAPEAGSAPDARGPEGALRLGRKLGIAGGLFALDAGVFGTALVGCVVAGLLSFAGMLLAIVRLFADPVRARADVAAAAIYFVTVIAIVIVSETNSAIGYANAERIITAVESYRADHDDEYPARLQDLVPGYLEAIPTCAYRLIGCEYRYLTRPELTHLLWEETPPFGRPTYDFAAERWGYVD